MQVEIKRLALPSNRPLPGPENDNEDQKEIGLCGIIFFTFKKNCFIFAFPFSTANFSSKFLNSCYCGTYS